VQRETLKPSLSCFTELLLCSYSPVSGSWQEQILSVNICVPKFSNTRSNNIFQSTHRYLGSNLKVDVRIQL
jgi:hypothetical protein